MTNDPYANTSEFVKAIDDAIKYTKLLRSPPAREVALAKAEELRQRDPRFSVYPRVTGDSES